MGAPKIVQPTPPDPVATAAAQTQMNKETAISQAGLNATNQYGPNGSLEYTQVGKWEDGTPHYAATQTYSPVQQQLDDLNNQTQLSLGQTGLNQSNMIGKLLSSPVDYSSDAIGKITSGMAAVPQASDYAVSTTAPNARYTDATGFATDASKYVTDASAPMARYTTGQIASNDQLTSQLFAAGSQRLNPVLNQSRDATETLLANKGLKVGSTAYDRAMTLEGQKANDAYNQLFLTGQNQAFGQAATRQQTQQSANQQNYGMDLSGKTFTLGANAQNFGQELSANGQNFNQALGANQQNYGMDLSNATYTQGAQAQNFGQANTTYGNQTGQRAQALSEIAAARNQPLNEISALLSGSQVTAPTWVNTPNTSVQPTDYTGLVNGIYASQVSNANSVNQARASAQAGLYSGIGSIFGGLMKFSDERLKENVVELGRDPVSGHGIYEFDYKPETGLGNGQRQIGLMAQDVEQRNPEAVATTGSGFKAVNYGAALSGVGGAFNRKRAA